MLVRLFLSKNAFRRSVEFSRQVTEMLTAWRIGLLETLLVAQVVRFLDIHKSLRLVKVFTLSVIQH